jgi:hypothetical protein
MGFFMAYGFLLIYLRDFAPGKEEWANSYSIGKHFETRLAHVHGNLFAFLNILIGYLLLRFSDKLKNVKVHFLVSIDRFIDATWNTIGSVFWLTTCFSFNRCNSNDSFGSVAWSCIS